MSMSRRGLMAAAAALPVLWRVEDAIAQGVQPKRGGTLTTIVNPEPPVLHIGINNQGPTLVVGGKIFQGLLRYDSKLAPMPELAKSWEVSADGLEYTFHLQENVKFHDGKPMTADDVVFSIMKFHMELSPRARGVFGRIKDGIAVNPTTVKFVLSAPFEPFLLMFDNTVSAIVPKHLFEGTDFRQSPAVAKPIGTGPFKFVEYQRGQYVIAERNPDYWREGFPYLDRIVWRFITDRAAATAALETGAVQISAYNGLPLADLDRLRTDPRFEVSTRGVEANVFNNTLEFNTRRKELADVRVRRAIVHAIDVPFFLENFLYGLGKPATGPIPSLSPEFFPNNPVPYPFDKAKAEALLDEAGFRRGAGGVRFTLRMVPIQNGEDVPLLATFVQQSLQQVGIRVEIVQLDIAGALTAVYRDWNFDLATGWHQYRGDPAVSTTVWYRSGSPKGAPWTNQYGWQSDTVDQLIDRAATELDPARRKALYAEFVKAVNEEIPVAMLTERPFYTATSNKVQNHHTTPRWDSGDCHDTWLAP